VVAQPRVASALAWIGADEELRAVLAQMPDAAIDVEIIVSWLAEAAWATADAALAGRLEPHLLQFRNRWTFYWFDCEVIEAPATRGLSHLTALLGRWEESERLFEKALADVVAVARHALAARLRFERGDLLRRLARDDAGLVAQARREASELGLAELVALIDRRHGATPPAPRRVPRPPAFTMTLEGEYFALSGTSGTLRFKASRGFQYLAMLVERPNADLHVLELMGSKDADRGSAGELVDPWALRAYRTRLQTLREALDTAEELGDSTRAARVRDEMEAIAAEIGRTTKKGGRARHAESAVDRARSAVQRRIRDAIERIVEQDEELGKWLRRAIRTGNSCSFRPDA
jgi:hypothetical protein